MKYKIFNYNITEIDLLQLELNNLTNQGYQIDKLGFISRFSKTNQKRNYQCFIYQKPKKSNNLNLSLKTIWGNYANSPTSLPTIKNNKKLQYVQNIEDKGYTYVGHINKILVFESKTSNNSLDIKPVLKKDYSYLNGSIVSFAFFIGVFLIISSKLSLNNLITNGSILITSLPILFLLFSLIYFSFSYFNILKFKANKPNKIKNILNKIKTFFLIFTVSVSILGFCLDLFERKKQPLDLKEVITLNDFGYKNPSNLDADYYSSFVIAKTINSYQNNNQEILFAKQYQIKNKKIYQKYLNKLINTTQAIKQENSNKGELYLAKTDKINDLLIYSFQDKIIFLSASFEFNQANIKKVIEFY